MTPPAGDLPSGVLVSVRSVAEAIEAVAGGAAIIDVKEPARGPLGRADAEVAAAIGRVAAPIPWTVACGELADGEASIASHVERVVALAEPGLGPPLGVKAGPAGLTARQWTVSYGRLVGRLPAAVDAVAVAYADFRAASAPPPAEVIEAAASAGATAVLIDTFSKSEGGLFQVADEAVVRGWIRQARLLGLRVALAGRLSAADVGVAADLGAVIVGVRSAACVGGRMGTVVRGHVAGLVGTLAGTRPRVDATRLRDFGR